MTAEQFRIIDPKMPSAMAELQELIRSFGPSTTFSFGETEDPDGVYMRAIVDVEDTDDVTELIIDRLADFQIDEGLPIYVVTRTPERIADFRQQQETRSRLVTSRQEPARHFPSLQARRLRFAHTPITRQHAKPSGPGESP